MRVQSEMAKEGYRISITKLCRWFGVSRRTFYYKPVNREKKLDPDKVAKVREKMEQFPTYGYRRLAWLLNMNKKAVQRILQLKGWQVKKRSKGHRPRAKAKTPEAALQEELIYRFGKLQRLETPIVLRSDNGLVFTSRSFTKSVKDYNFEQEFITPYTPEQNGMIERFFRTIKEECIWHHNFKSLKEANDIIGNWIHFYNRERKHSAIKYKTPVEVFRLVA